MTSVTEGVMQVGNFRATLDDAAPRSIVENIPEFSTLCITPGRCDGLSRSEVLSVATYSGMIRQFSANRCVLGGPSIMAWIGDEGGKLTAYNDSVDGTTSAVAMINDLFDTAAMRGGMTLGSTAGLPGTPVWAAIQTNATAGVPETRRAFLDRVCRVFDWQYRVTPQGVIDVEPRGDLFRTDPAVIVLADHLGEPVSSVGYVTVNGRVDATENWDDWASRVWTYDGTYSGIASRPFPYADNFSSTIGSSMDSWKWIAGTDYGSDATADLEAATLLEQEYDVRQEVSLTIDLDDPRARIEPGDLIYVYDPLQGLYDLDNQLDVMGQPIAPVLLEVTQMTWSPSEGMGMYVLLNGTTTAWDLSEYALWSGGTTSLTVGAAPRSLAEVVNGRN